MKPFVPSVLRVVPDGHIRRDSNDETLSNSHDHQIRLVKTSGVPEGTHLIEAVSPPEKETSVPVSCPETSVFEIVTLRLVATPSFIRVSV